MKSSAEDQKNKSNQQYNRIIAHLIMMLVERRPELRFGQILNELSVVKAVKDSEGDTYWKDEFYTESKEILSRVGDFKKFLKDLKEK